MTAFTLIPQKRMGKLKPALRKELSRIEIRRNELTAEFQQLETAEQQILVQAAEHLKIDTDGPFRGLHVDDDGTVHALYCTCANCQAELNSVSVTDATEAMIERGYIHADLATQMRQRAASVDRQRGTPVVH